MAASAAKKSSGTKVWLIALIFVSVILLIGVFAAAVSSLGKGQGSIARIQISGAIGGGDLLSGSGVNPDEIVDMIERADSDSTVRGILIEINSPGGTPVASEEMMRAVKGTSKPTVALIRDIGASGAYWVASAASYIVASPVSLTGSVGVRSSYLEFSQFLSRYGVRYESLASGEYKELGSPYRNLTDVERELLLDELAKTHDYFLSSVAENRQITSEENLGIIASARVFLGSEALELGLVDVLGGRKEAEDWLKEHTNLTEINYISYERKPFFNIGGLAAEQASIIGRSLGHSVATTLVWSGSRPLETLQT
ncbi:MAG TPA: signal peptide peptidase SppA [Candidatus Nanoarchaeia archaeon]|nr:signal peptide peptidase SppA [Candidatus Nanoarchaeia archaeon]